MATGSDIPVIQAQAEKILASGVLGRSRFYSALLEYLVVCHARGHTPKEVEIAADVFSRGQDFDPSQDSMVRVYAHNLRQKLQQFYAEQGSEETEQIAIPKGEYRLAVVPVAAAGAGAPTVVTAEAARQTGATYRFALLVAASLIAGILIDRLFLSEDGVSAEYREVASSPLWSAVTDDDLPVTIVVGDYYIFGELDRYGNIVRMVREFEINSSRDLDDLFMLDPDAADRYVDLDLTYLPSSTAFAVRDIVSVLAAANKQIRIVPSSHLNPAALRESHIVYVGYLSGLGMLSDFAFAGSRLALGESYDEIVDQETGKVFVSEAGLPSLQGSYRDYGFFSTQPGPGSNELVFVAGTRDEGLMQTSRAVSAPDLVPESVAAVTGEDGKVAPAFDLLYEVAGMDRTNLDSMIVHAAPLTTNRITIGNLTP